MTNEELAALLTKLDGEATPGPVNRHHVSEAHFNLLATYRNHHAQIVAGLAALGEVERMRAEIQGGALVPISEWNITIAERDALKVVLQPFADACTKADASSEGVRRAGMGHGHSDDATPGWGIRYKHLKAARAALQPAKEKT